MPNVLFEDSMQAQEPWPQEITLYQPHEVEQILLSDNANCLAVRAFLKMCHLDFDIQARSNAEYMSPTGKVPFIKCGSSLVAEFDGIVSFLGYKGISLSGNVDEIQRLDTRAYISLVNNVFGNAELYVSWLDPEAFERTKRSYEEVYPWPLNHYLTWQKKREVTKRLKSLGYYNKSLDDICKEVDDCCTALSTILHGKTYFSGEEPSELDALVYGHVSSFLKTNLPLSIQQIANIIHKYPKIMACISKIKSYIDQPTSLCAGDFEMIETVSKDTIWDDLDFKPNELDALVFSHVFTIITTTLPRNTLANVVNKYKNLTEHCMNIELQYFKRPDDVGQSWT